MVHGVIAAGFHSRQQAQRVAERRRRNGWTSVAGALMFWGFYIYVPSISIETCKLNSASYDMEMTEWHSMCDRVPNVA